MDSIAKPQIQSQTLADRYTKYQKMFLWDKATMIEVCGGIGKEIRQGLRHHKNPQREDASSLALLDTCVAVSPTGLEQGTYYAVDFGGTNLRIVRVRLHAGEPEVTQAAFNITELSRCAEIPNGIMDSKATATMLFDMIAKCCRQFMETTEDLKIAQEEGRDFGCGFTFSFPMKQCAIDSGFLTLWTKGFETGRDTNDKVEGVADVCQLLDAAFVRCQVPLAVRAALNDTTGTLLSAAYALRYKTQREGSKNKHPLPPCAIGLIVGTGMNACYIEKQARQFGYQGIILNTECGNYKNFLPRNIIDRQIDCSSGALGQQLTEKMCSGLYLAEICRRAILRVFRWQAPPLTWVHGALTTAACCAAAYDKTNDLAAVRCMLERQLEWQNVDSQTLKFVHGICRAVLMRSATLVACILTALGRQTGRLQYAAGGLSVGIDGSVYGKNEGYRTDLRAALDHLLDNLSGLLHLHQSTDGSGLGAGILAALQEARLSRKASLLDF